MNLLSNKRIWVLLRIFVGFIFAYAGFSKLLEPAVNFEVTLIRYGVFPLTWIPLMARVIPWLEWILGCFFILGYRLKATALAISLLGLSFLVTLGSSNLFLSSGESPCGCFGAHGLKLTLHQIFLLDLFSLIVALRIYFLQDMPFTIYSLVKRRSRPDDKHTSKKESGR